MDNYITKLSGAIQNSNLKKLHEVKLRAISDGNLSITTNGDATITVLSGTVTYNGSPITTMPITSGNWTFVMTSGAKVSIIGKEKLTKLQSSVSELTDGYTLEDLSHSPLTHLQLTGDTAGSIESLDASILVKLYLDNTKVTGSIDVFANSTALTGIRIEGTQVGGHLSSLVGKALESSSHFKNSNIFVDVADIASMSSGNTNVQKYQNCYLYGDVSSMAAEVAIISKQDKDKIMSFTWLTQRHTDANNCIIVNTFIPEAEKVAFMNYGDYLDAMLIDQAQCKDAPSGDVIYVWGNHTANSGWENAVSTLKTRGYSVYINGKAQ